VNEVKTSLYAVLYREATGKEEKKHRDPNAGKAEDAKAGDQRQSIDERPAAREAGQGH
jgi:hypothetical protein